MKNIGCVPLKRVLVFLAAAGGSWAGTIYSVTDLGGLGGASAAAFSINDAGGIAGWADTTLGTTEGLVTVGGSSRPSRQAPKRMGSMTLARWWARKGRTGPFGLRLG